MYKFDIYSFRNTGSKIIFAVTGTVFVLTLYFVVEIYLTHIRKAKEQTLDKLEAIARTTSLVIDADQHEWLSNSLKNKDDIMSSGENELYEEIHNTLKSVQTFNHLNTPIYTLVYDSIDNDFKFIVTSAEKPYFRHSYKEYPPDLIEKYNEGAKIGIYKTENGTWLTAFAPLKNSSGKTVALINVDEESGLFIRNARKELVLNLGISILLFGVVMALLYIFLNSMLKKEEIIRELLIEQNDEIIKQNRKIEIRTYLIRKNNEKLKDAKQVIEDQNEKLKDANVALDKKVKLRTSELELASKELNQFLYQSSHDILGPIATLKGLCYLARIEFANDQASAFIDKFQETVDKLTNIINSINSVYLIKTKRLDFKSVNLHQLVQSMIDVQFSKFKQEVNFKLKIPKSYEAKLEAELTDIILRELIKNAINFRYLDGEHPHFVRIESYENNANQLVLLICDNGQGISKEMEQHIYELFSRATDTSKGSGSGLGLYIVKHALLRLKGEISIIRNPSHNDTVFEIRLPLL